MTRRMQAAYLLAAGALVATPLALRAQATTTPVSKTTTAAPAALPTATEADIQMLRADIRAKRKQVMAANITLTPDEATKFWPLFDEYTAEVRKVNDKRWAMMKDYAASFNQLTDSQAIHHVEVSAAVDAELISLRAKWLPQFQKLLPPKKVVQFYQVDRRLDLLMNIQISSLIPIVAAN